MVFLFRNLAINSDKCVPRAIVNKISKNKTEKKKKKEYRKYRPRVRLTGCPVGWAEVGRRLDRVKFQSYTRPSSAPGDGPEGSRGSAAVVRTFCTGSKFNVRKYIRES